MAQIDYLPEGADVSGWTTLVVENSGARGMITNGTEVPPWVEDPSRKGTVYYEFLKTIVGEVGGRNIYRTRFYFSTPELAFEFRMRWM